MADHNSIFSVNGCEFKLDDNSVLEKVISSGFSMPYSCQDGRCKNCEIIDCNTGSKYLACQTSAKQGQSFYCENFEEFSLPSVRQLPMKIVEVNQVGSFIEVKLIYSKSISIEYLRGQYINLAIAGVVRSYSICTLNDLKKELTIMMSPVSAGVASAYFSSSPIGEKIRVSVPLGSFVYREPNNSSVLSAYICTGSGIVPVLNTFDGGRSIPDNVNVYWGMRENCEMVSKIHLASIEKIKIFISSSKVDHNYNKGRISWESINQRENIANWYLVGNPQMIEDFSSMIRASNSDCRIYSDPFV